MPKFAKKEAPEQKSASVLKDPEIRKKFKSALATVTHYFDAIDKQKEGMKETIAELSQEYGLDKKTVRKLASTMYKHNYGTLQEENRHFEILYETIIEGRLRNADGSAPDPLDDEDTDDAEE